MHLTSCFSQVTVLNHFETQWNAPMVSLDPHTALICYANNVEDARCQVIKVHEDEHKMVVSPPTKILNQNTEERRLERLSPRSALLCLRLSAGGMHCNVIGVTADATKVLEPSEKNIYSFDRVLPQTPLATLSSWDSIVCYETLDESWVYATDCLPLSTDSHSVIKSNHTVKVTTFHTYGRAVIALNRSTALFCAVQQTGHEHATTCSKIILNDVTSSPTTAPTTSSPTTAPTTSNPVTRSPFLPSQPHARVTVKIYFHTMRSELKDTQGFEHAVVSVLALSAGVDDQEVTEFALSEAASTDSSPSHQKGCIVVEACVCFGNDVDAAERFSKRFQNDASQILNQHGYPEHRYGAVESATVSIEVMGRHDDGGGNKNKGLPVVAIVLTTLGAITAFVGVAGFLGYRYYIVNNRVAQSGYSSLSIPDSDVDLVGGEGGSSNEAANEIQEPPEV